MPNLIDCRIVVCSKQGKVDDVTFLETMQRFHADNPKFRPRVEPLGPGQPLNLNETFIRNLGDSDSYRGILCGKCLELTNGWSPVINELSTLSKIYPELHFACEWSDPINFGGGHYLMTDGKLSHEEFHDRRYVPSVCTPEPFLLDYIVPNSLPEKALAKLLRARKVVDDFARMVASDFFTGSPQREGGDREKTRKITDALRSSSDALKALDGIDFHDVIVDDNPTPEQAERYRNRVREEEDVTDKNLPALAEVAGDGGAETDNEHVWGSVRDL